MVLPLIALQWSTNLSTKIKINIFSFFCRLLLSSPNLTDFRVKIYKMDINIFYRDFLY
jgi:hypothetical protein